MLFDVPAGVLGLDQAISMQQLLDWNDDLLHRRSVFPVVGSDDSILYVVITDLTRYSH
jgi:hypothetical protein